MVAPTEVLRRIRSLVKQEGVLHTLLVFTAGPIILLWAAAGRLLVTVGNWMQDVVGS